MTTTAATVPPVSNNILQPDFEAAFGMTTTSNALDSSGKNSKIYCVQNIGK